MYIKKGYRTNPIINGRKKCSKCGVEKSPDAFLFQHDRNRHRAECKECARIRKGMDSREVMWEKRKQYIKDLEATGEKECKRCGKIKKFSLFGKATNGGIGGVKTVCKECLRIPKDQWKSTIPKNKLTNEERIKRKDEQNLKARERYRNNAEHREKRKQYERDTHKKDRSKMLARKHKRESLMINQNDKTVTAKEIKQVLFKSKTCPYCGKRTNKPELDHMNPLSRGGLHSISNIIGCCHSCNSLKRNKSFQEWMMFIPEGRKDYVIGLYKRKQGASPKQIGLPFRYAA